MCKVQLKLLCLVSLWLTNQKCFTLIHSYKSDPHFLSRYSAEACVSACFWCSQMLPALNLFISECFKSSFWVRGSLPCISVLHYQTSKCRRLFCNCGEKPWAFTSPMFFILKSANIAEGYPCLDPSLGDVLIQGLIVCWLISCHSSFYWLPKSPQWVSGLGVKTWVTVLTFPVIPEQLKKNWDPNSDLKGYGLERAFSTEVRPARVLFMWINRDFISLQREVLFLCLQNKMFWDFSSMVLSLFSAVCIKSTQK